MSLRLECGWYSGRASSRTRGNSLGWKFANQGLMRRSGQVNLGSFQGPGGVVGFEHDIQEWSFFEVPMVYTCVSRIVRRLRGFPRRVVDMEGRPVGSKPMWLENPNPLMSGADLISSIALSLLLEGEAFLFPLRDRAGRVVFVGVANPLLMQHYTIAGRVAWRVNGIETDMPFLHLRDLTLPGRIRGVRRVEPLDRLSKISLGALKYTQQHLARGGAYQLVLTSTRGRATSSAEGRAQLRQALRDYHSGWRNAYNPLVLPPDIEAKPLDPKMLNADKGFLDLMNTDDSKIAVGFGIDPMEVGIGVDGMSRTYTNEPARLHRFYRDAIEPVKLVIEDGLSELAPGRSRVQLDEREWLTGGPHDRAQLVEKMALANKHGARPVFSPEEMREVAGFEGPPPPAPAVPALPQPAAMMPAQEGENDAD